MHTPDVFEAKIRVALERGLSAVEVGVLMMVLTKDSPLISMRTLQKLAKISRTKLAQVLHILEEAELIKIKERTPGGLLIDDEMRIINKVPTDHGSTQTRSKVDAGGPIQTQVVQSGRTPLVQSGRTWPNPDAPPWPKVDAGGPIQTQVRLPGSTPWVSVPPVGPVQSLGATVDESVRRIEEALKAQSGVPRSSDSQ